MRRVCGVILGVLLIALTPATAAAEADREAARQRFLRGVELIQQERWEEGLEEFRESYELSPTQSALFNHALCLRLLRRYAEAMEVLTEYRRLYADSVPASRLAEVEREIATIRELVGRLEVQLGGASSAEVYIDNERAGHAPTTEPLIVAPGRHSVEVRAPGFQPYRQSIALSSGEDITLTASMVRAVANAEIQVEINVLDARVSIDGREAGLSPLGEPVRVVAGEHSIEAERPGYQGAELTVEVAANATAVTDLILRPLVDLPEEDSGRLELSLSHDDARVRVDGLPFDGGPLPVGRHHVEVSREGMSSHRQEVEVAPGQATQLRVQLVPGAEGATPRGGRARSLVWSGVAIGAVGVAALAAGVALIIWNNGRVDDWAAEDDRLRRVLAEYQQNPELYVWEALNRQIEANDQLSDSIQTMSVVAPVLIGLGGAALVTGATLLGLGLRRRPAAEAARLRLTPTLGGLALSGAF